MTEASTETQEDFWLFGYGCLLDLETATAFRSLIPKINEFPGTLMVIEDHRGSPEHPGRVVTLIERSDYLSIVPNSDPPPTFRVWGAAYHIPSQHVREVKEYLDIREVNGYSIQYASVQPASDDAKPIEKCMVYIGLPSNQQFLGPQDADALAKRICGSRGPSGENREYLFMLEESLNGLAEKAGDEHVEDLAERTRKVGLNFGEDGATVGDGRSIEAAIEEVRCRMSDHSEIEETTKP
ncbi:MAG: hypothetical protein Q9209_000754 [Squamulea sp. 1 TL-2023]